MDSEKSTQPSSEQAPTEPSTITIHTPNGPVIALNEGDLIVTQGLKYATQKRFTPPLPLEPWTEPIDCTRPGPLCPQLPFDFEPLGDKVNLDRPTSEHCLTVNVVAPAEAKNLPVLVWIHGGAYVCGTGDLELYDTRGLARREIVVVSVQYRLGIFGYAEIPGVAPANLGLMDQIAALQWVKENVASFGGDPTQTTVFGQSAGGDSVFSLLLAEGTENLFQRAVIMSSPFGLFHAKATKPAVIGKNVKTKTKPEDLPTTSEANLLRIGAKILKKTKKRGLLAPGFYIAPGKKPMPLMKEYDARLKARAAKIPLLIGWTKHDVLPFLTMSPALAPLKYVPPVLMGISYLATYFNFAKGSIALHREFLAEGGESVAFKIEWYPKGSKFRACHCMETPLLFGGYDEWVTTPILAGADREVFEKLAAEMKRLLVAFVEGGGSAAERLVVAKDWEYIDAKN